MRALLPVDDEPKTTIDGMSIITSRSYTSLDCVEKKESFGREENNDEIYRYEYIFLFRNDYLLAPIHVAIHSLVGRVEAHDWRMVALRRNVTVSLRVVDLVVGSIATTTAWHVVSFRPFRSSDYRFVERRTTLYAPFVFRKFRTRRWRYGRITGVVRGRFGGR